jgi:hypothetical protein
MKPLIKSFLQLALGLGAAMTAATSFTSCNEDKCKAIVCAYGGSCNDGVCTCVNGFEGPQCETQSTLKYLGTWDVMETGSQSEEAQYTLTIDSMGGDVTKLKIKGLNNMVFNVEAFVVKDTLHIPEQNVAGIYTVEGFGYLRHNSKYGETAEMLVQYYITDQRNGLTNDFGFLTTQDASLWNKLK